MTINYAFAMFDVDKVIAQTTEATFGSVGLNSEKSAATGVLRDYLYFRGRHWDCTRSRPYAASGSGMSTAHSATSSGRG